MGDTKATGLELLEQKLAEFRANDEDLNSNNVDVTEEPAEEVKASPDEVVVVDENKQNDEVAKSDIEAKTEEVTEESDGETTEENVYSPNYQYKFQDEFFEFDARVKSAIKSEEDEEFFRDLYTKSRAMELMKERADEASKNIDEYKSKYSDVETKYTETSNMVNYFTNIMDGVNRGDPNAFNQFLSLCDVKDDSLKRLGLALAEHIENPQQYTNTLQSNQVNYRQEQIQQQQQSFEEKEVELARRQTEFEVKRAINNPELSDLVAYVDNTWGEGTFEKRVWSEGEALEASGKSVSFNDIPNIVSNVADWFGKARPTSNSPQQPSIDKAPQVKQRIVDNPTPSLPQVKGDKGIPQKPVYEAGAGIEGLQKRYKNLTGSEW